MSGLETVDLDQQERIFCNPWPALALALAVLLIALPLAETLGSFAFALIFIALVIGGAGVAIRPSSPQVLGVAALCAGLAFVGLLSIPLGLPGSLETLRKVFDGQHPKLPTEWDSARLVVGVMTVIAAAASLLMLLPRATRRIVVSLLVLVHFGGIVTATLTVPPCPWLSNMVWMYFYRPYLEFAYLVNAYHFYSPEPGPATQLWFYVKYEDGTSDWYKTPQVGEPPLKLEYLRRLALAEYANQKLPGSLLPQAKIEARVLAGRRDGVLEHMVLPANLQYVEPKLSSKIVLESYARRMFRHPPSTDKVVIGVKIYRVMHALMTPKQFAEGKDPEEPDQFGVYYMGEYDAQGRIKDPEDPYLYWLIPSVRFNLKPDSKGPIVWGPEGPIGMDRDPEVFPFLQKHAKLPTPVQK